MTSLLAITLPPIIDEHRTWWIAGAIVVIGLLIIGVGDLLRFSWRRTWAISGVCFAESYRKRILLITPLTILGALIVTQLQHPVDEADAVRQTVKFCLFATGLVLVVTAIILACTNLPREIENRVIFTVVTKPTTRLEIVLGKIIGFARVSALILIVMGLFTWGYLRLRSVTLQRTVAAAVQSDTLDPAVAAIYSHYNTEGLLQARELEATTNFQVYSTLAPLGSKVRYMGFQGDNDLVAPFALSLNDLVAPGEPNNVYGSTGLAIAIRIGFQRNATIEAPQAVKRDLPIGIAAPEPSPEEQLAPPKSAVVQVQLMNENQESLIGSDLIPGARNVELTDPTGSKEIVLRIPPDACGELLRYLHTDEERLVYVYVAGMTGQAEYIVADDAVRLLVLPATPNQKAREILPPLDRRTGKPAIPILRGRQGTEGQQIRGGAPGKAPVAVFHFQNPDASSSSASDVPFEVKTSIEKSREDDEVEDPTTLIEVEALNRKTGKLSEPVKIPVESHRTAYFKLPAAAVADGEFDIHVRSITPGHYVSFYPNSLQMVAGRGSFDFNLFKSLLIMWLMSLLVISVAIFCSTFLSWPIAVVLTLLILLGHWGVQQLGDSLQPGIGPAMAQDMGLKDPRTTRVLSQSVEMLARSLNVLSGVLPDISKFAATEDIEKGVSISGRRLLDSLGVLGGYALPMAVLAYLLLRKKEVAP